MNIYCRLLLSAVLLFPFASLSVANPPTPTHRPHPTQQRPSHQRVYWVYYRECPASPWVCFGGYYHHSQAVQASNYFRGRGYDAFYR